MPMASSPRPPTLPAAQVRQYSWHHCAKKDVSDIRREFVGTNKQTNRISPFLSQQAPLVSKVHLLKVVRKIGKSERLKGKHLTDFVFKAPHLSREKNMTSLLPSCQKSEGGSYPYSVLHECSNAEMNPFDHVSPHTNNIYTLKTSETRKNKEVKFKCLGSTNCFVMVSDVLITEPDNDVIIRDVEINKPIAGKRYSQQHSLLSKKGFIRSSLSMGSKTFTKIALILAIVISILGGMFNVNLPERISAIGTSSCFPHSEPRAGLRCHGYPTPFGPMFARDVLAGKRFNAYISPSADFWASRVYYLDTYTVNLDSDDNFKVFHDLIYIYIYIYIYFKNTKNLFIHIALIPEGDNPRVNPNILKCLLHSPVAKGYRLVVIASRAIVCKTPTHYLILNSLAFARGCVILRSHILFPLLLLLLISRHI